MKLKLIIFDLDGTLLNTIEDLGRACNHALEMCGCPLRQMDEYNAFVGRGIYNLFRAALPESCRTEERVQEMAGHFIPYYNAHITDFTRPYEGVMEMLEAFAGKGIRFAVASNKYQEGTEKLVETFFGRFSFVRILGQRDGMPIKPDPKIIDEILEAAGDVTREETLYVGDSNVDMQTGANSGLRTIGAAWGFRGKEELEAFSPWRICASPAETCMTVLGEIGKEGQE